MNKHEIHETLYKQLCAEIGQIVETMQRNQTLSDQQAERLRILYSIKEKMLTCKAMEDSEDYTDQEYMDKNGISGYRGRGANGRYISRDMNDSRAYSDGYSEGYSAAMGQMNPGNSGHYPMIAHDPYYNRRW